MRIVLACLLLLLIAACAPRESIRPMTHEFAREIRQTRHAGADDLLSAGLGLDGLRGAAPGFDDPARPTPAELRRRAIWTNWRGIVDLSPAGGFGSVYGSAAKVDGREYSTFAQVPGASTPHRVLAQIPDAFERSARCLVVAPVSGSRGVYGTIGFAGSWALPRGCAVVYTDKGLGTDIYDPDSGTGVALDGTRSDSGALAFATSRAAGTAPHRIAYRHAHSGDNPEADWGAHTLQAMRFGLHALDLAFPTLAPFTPDNTRIIAMGLSNGGGAVLRAAELPGGEAFDAVVAAAPNITAPGARHLFDFALDAALYQPCLFADPDFEGAPGVLPPEAMQAAAIARCASLAEAGLLQAAEPVAQAREALALLRARGWEELPLALAAFHSGLDLWRSLIATYAQSYSRASVTQPVCGYGFGMLDAGGAPRASTPVERAAWWADGNGIGPGMGIALLDTMAQGQDRGFPALDCVRRLRADEGAAGATLAQGIRQTLSTATPRSARVLVVHGANDGLVPATFTSRAWTAAVRGNAPAVALRYWEPAHVQHFDAFLGAPAFAGRMLPLLAYAHQAMDIAWHSVRDGGALPDALPVVNRVPAAGTALRGDDLGRLVR